ncbi:MAG: RNA polymerase subunit sigma-70, partial [Acidobacteria bacterium]|nr:RNA polymerase subunit sigma-70 [Acidobacteriota bacterium]
MQASPPGTITELLRQWSGGDPRALEELLPLVHRHLSRLAASYLRRERAGHTLQTQALVNEAFLALLQQERVSWRDRAHFFAVAAQAMRRILVDHARRRTRTKRGGGAPHQDVAMERLAARPDDGDADTFLQLDRLIEQLSRDDPRAGEIVRLRFFAGL